MSRRALNHGCGTFLVSLLPVTAMTLFNLNRTAVALDAVVDVANALFQMFRSDSVWLVLVTTEAGEMAEIVADMAGRALCVVLTL